MFFLPANRSNNGMLSLIRGSFSGEMQLSSWQRGSAVCSGEDGNGNVTHVDTVITLHIHRLPAATSALPSSD